MKSKAFEHEENILKVHPLRKISGVLEPPPDKSISHRAVIISSLFKGTSSIENFLMARDTLATVECLRKVGVQIEFEHSGKLSIESQGLQSFIEPEGVLDARNSATTMRLLAGVFSAARGLRIITGDQYLVKRPMKRIIEPLSLMGARIYSRAFGYPPLTIVGSRLSGIEYRMKIASAQVKSAIILAGLFARGRTTIIEPAKSRDHTERMLQHVGVSLRVEGNTIEVEEVGDLNGSLRFSIPGDPSSAAFFVVASAISSDGELRVINVNLNPTRTGFLDVLKRSGAKVDVKVKGYKCGEPYGEILVKPSSEITGFYISKEEVPLMIDEIPILAVYAAFARGKSYFEGLSELRVKETDRLKAVAENLSKMGVKVKVEGENLEIQGCRKLKGATLDSFGDHRIAMAFTVAALFAEGSSTILNPSCIDVSYPGFLKDLEKLSA